MRSSISSCNGATLIHGARCAIGPQENIYASIKIAHGRIMHILHDRALSPSTGEYTEINLSGFLVMPGLVNAHDHLQFALHPRLANPPYRNYIDWGEDIHARFPDLFAKYRSIPRDVRLWWGGIRNLLCGVTTVCHHDTLWPELQREDFPTKVIQKYGWGHSLALGGDLHAAYSATPADSAFIIHACEGLDEQMREELFELDRLNLLNENTVLVHGLAIDSAGFSLLQAQRASLIVCPSSNKFLFDKLPDMDVLGTLENIALGNDSPLTATGDLLDEIRFAIVSCGIAPRTAYHMVTEAPAKILRLSNDEGEICASGAADLIAIQDTGQHAADRLRTLSITDIELVIVAGRVQLASEAIWKRLPSQSRDGLNPLSIDGTLRWLRAPVNELLQRAEEILGPGQVRLGGRQLCSPPHCGDAA
ncbi:amidohydrolase family protein [Granulicella sp. WH15]|uniref:amidohydrolase family protein n=1 Tax=Granulicella sp. WH15 TaxID=2602070 RepID=UPI00136780D2|nr:amidohydrolase family protein [Granulicella sp. WH15]QHN04978.1 amidohydrolase family protein [Granulicella sp. WH15]